MGRQEAPSHDIAGLLDKVHSRLAPLLGGRLLVDEPMRKHTSWRVGGPAGLFATVEDTAEIGAALSACRDEGVPWFVLGKGTDLLVSDEGWSGLVLQLGSGFRKLAVQGALLEAAAGVPLTQLAQIAERNGLGGLTFAVAIPGSLGGALVTNAGAHGRCLGDIVRSVTVLGGDGELMTMAREALEFGYRTSSLEGRGVIVEAALNLHAESRAKLRGEMARFFRQRKETQPWGVPSAGSVFKNPADRHAGELIDNAGLKGRSRGAAIVSERHANFITVSGTASASDIYGLMGEVQAAVAAASGVVLQPEVRLLGHFEPPLLKP